MVNRVIITTDPYEDLPIDPSVPLYSDHGYWPCKWISLSHTTDQPIVIAYRRKFTLKKEAVIRVHVSADERYELFLDGQRICRGSERGDRIHWYYESYDFEIPAGSHVLIARVWSMRHLAPTAQLSTQHGFIFSPQDPVYIKLLGTGVATWDAKVLPGYGFRKWERAWGTGAKVIVDAATFDWDFVSGLGKGWRKTVSHERGLSGFEGISSGKAHLMVPAILPPMIEEPCQVGSIRFVAAVESAHTTEIPIRTADDIAADHSVWQSLISGKGSVTIPAQTRRRIIIDLDNYYCAYPFMITSGGAGSIVRVYWDEALYPECDFNNHQKDNRDEIDGKFFFGIGDTFKPDGGDHRLFETLWWETGRFIELYIETADQNLTIEQFGIRETRYPLEMESRFSSSDSRLSEIIPVMVRGLQMCSHETYMDCPFYEQLQYVGDTRLEALVTYTIARDSRLPKKAIAMFDASRNNWGLTNCSYPHIAAHIIAPFSLWWIGMIHDYALWRGDRVFVSQMMPGARGVIDYCYNHIGSDGLFKNIRGWNFMDWVRKPHWQDGVPPGARTDANGMLNWQFVYVLMRMAELEEYVGEPELAARVRRIATTLASRLREVFWDDSRGMYAETRDKQHFTEHTQCLALLSGIVNSHDALRLSEGLTTAPDLFRTTIYFSHYLLETFGKIGRMDLFFNRMAEWFDLKKFGLKTTYEEYVDKTRSDCHAWGAHPLYHYFATILGIRPAAPGFSTVSITPHLGHLASVSGTLVHPKGEIIVSFSQKDGIIQGSIDLPIGVSGLLILNGKTVPLFEGVQSV